MVGYDCETLTALIGALLRNGFRVTVVSDGVAMERALADRPMDLVLLDVLVPDEEGLPLCRRVREFGSLPLILLAARANEGRAIQGLEHGADDYLIKPFSTQELLARIRAGLRRSDRLHWPRLT